jgi:hypothetical protein
MLILGKFYEEYADDLEKATRLYRQASHSNNSYAKIQLGKNILRNRGDLAACLRLYKQTALSGNSYAAYVLYTAYQDGFIIGSNYTLPPEELHDSPKKASYWFTKSHERGNPWVLRHHLNRFKDNQDFDGGIRYSEKYENPFIKKSEYFNTVGYFHMKKYELSGNEECFHEAKNNFEAAANTASMGIFSTYSVRTLEEATASLNLGWLYFTHSLHSPQTRAEDLQRAHYSTSSARYNSRNLSELTEEERNKYQEKVKDNWEKIKETAKILGIKLQSIHYD